jgi:asparagine synthase (glutamine-hydrolysing)
MRGLASRLPVSDENISWDFAVKRFCAGISYDLPARNQIWLGAFEPKAKRELFLEPFRKRIMGYDEFAFHKKIWAQCDSRNYLNQIWNLDLRFYLQDDMLVKVDRASMANSLEVRVPYLDHTLVEFVCAMPTHLKLKGFSTKYILKKVAEKYLPNDIIHRKKKGFGIPVAKWIKAGLKPMILDVLTGDSIKEAGIFHPEYIQGLLDDHFLGKRDFRKLLWTLFIFECWRQSHKQTILA